LVAPVVGGTGHWDQRFGFVCVPEVPYEDRKVGILRSAMALRFPARQTPAFVASNAVFSFYFARPGTSRALTRGGVHGAVRGDIRSPPPRTWIGAAYRSDGGALFFFGDRQRELRNGGIGKTGTKPAARPAIKRFLSEGKIQGRGKQTPILGGRPSAGVGAGNKVFCGEDKLPGLEGGRTACFVHTAPFQVFTGLLTHLPIGGNVFLVFV